MEENAQLTITTDLVDRLLMALYPAASGIEPGIRYFAKAELMEILMSEWRYQRDNGPFLADDFPCMEA